MNDSPAPALASLLDAITAEWDLRPDGAVIAGAASLVRPVLDAAGRRCALKVIRLDGDNLGESATLQLWGGRGAAALLRADPRRGALLLEWLDRPLTDELATDAVDQIAALYARLHRPAAPKLPSCYALVDRWLRDLEGLGRELPAPPRFVEQALRAGRQLIAGEPAHVIHGDLHDGNVLWRERTGEWVAIDPKGFNGDPCYEPAIMLLNRWDELGWYGNAGEAIRDRFYALTYGGALDERRTRDWVVVRTMVNVSWAVLDARTERRELTERDHEWITRNVTVAKAMQDIRP